MSRFRWEQPQLHRWRVEKLRWASVIFFLFLSSTKQVTLEFPDRSYVPVGPVWKRGDLCLIRRAPSYGAFAPDAGSCEELVGPGPRRALAA